MQPQRLASIWKLRAALLEELHSSMGTLTVAWRCALQRGARVSTGRWLSSCCWRMGLARLAHVLCLLAVFVLSALPATNALNAAPPSESEDTCDSQPLSLLSLKVCNTATTSLHVRLVIAPA